MEFNENRGIYLQIADQISEEILQHKWPPEERIPAIREMAGNSGVNPNTVTRSYQYLMDKGIIYNKRGVGYFVSQNASEIIKKEGREHFLNQELPRLFHTMQLLDISIKDIEAGYKQYQGGIV